MAKTDKEAVEQPAVAEQAPVETPVAAEEPTEFPTTLGEFLNELPKGQVEMKAGFQYACKASSLAGNKLRSKWQALLDQYNNLPVDAPLVEKEGGN